MSLKFSPPQQLSATFLASQTGLAAAAHDTQRHGAQVSYSYNTRRISWSNQIEHYGQRLSDGYRRSTTAPASPRAGLYGGVNFYPKEGTDFWLQRVLPVLLHASGDTMSSRTATKRFSTRACGSTSRGRDFSSMSP